MPGNRFEVHAEVHVLRPSLALVQQVCGESGVDCGDWRLVTRPENGCLQYPAVYFEMRTKKWMAVCCQRTRSCEKSASGMTWRPLKVGEKTSPVLFAVRYSQGKRAAVCPSKYVRGLDTTDF